MLHKKQSINITIKNWGKYQVIKKDRAPWIKLWVDLLHDTIYQGELNTTQKHLYTMLLLLSARKHGVVSGTALTICRLANCGALRDLQRLAEKNFIEIQEVMPKSPNSKKILGQPRQRQRQKAEAEKKEEKDPAGVQPPLPPGESLSAIWNIHRGKLAKCLQLTSKRLKQANARLKATPKEYLKINEALADHTIYAWEDYWTRVVKKMAALPFMNGENKRGWKATFDFLLKPDTHIGIREGKYDSTGKGGKPTPPRSRDAIAQFGRKLDDSSK